MGSQQGVISLIGKIRGDMALVMVDTSPELSYISWFGLSGNGACIKPSFHANMKHAIEPHLHF